MCQENKISVLMSVYKNEKARYLEEAILSIINQTIQPAEIVIIEDGPLTDELYLCLDKLSSRYEGLIFRYPLEKNRGLGLALKYGVEQCRYSLIARMDTDDIAVHERLEEQLRAFQKDRDLGLVGGQIAEFMTDPNEILTHRYVPLQHNDIIKYQRMRSAFNHMTVMFKKESVLLAGNYEHGLYMEDDLLWANMIQAGIKTANLPLVLCNVRVGEGMFDRRGGFSYFKNYYFARKKMYQRHQITCWDYWLSLCIQIIVCLVPSGVRQFLFIKLLRK